jgi:hypothetical protein
MVDTEDRDKKVAGALSNLISCINEDTSVPEQKKSKAIKPSKEKRDKLAKDAQNLLNEWNKIHNETIEKYGKYYEFNAPKEAIDAVKRAWAAYSFVAMQLNNTVSFRVTGTPTDEVVANGISLTPAQTAEVAANIFATLPEESRKKITDGLNGNILGLKDAILQIPASLASKENWNEEDKQMAAVVRDVIQGLVDANPTSRPLTTKEALWMLYDSTNTVKDLVDAASRAFVAHNL